MVLTPYPDGIARPHFRTRGAAFPPVRVGYSVIDDVHCSLDLRERQSTCPNVL